MSVREWTDPSQPPVDDCIELGGGVWASWADGWTEKHPDGRTRPMLWHWCDRSVIKTKDSDRLPEWYEPQWAPAGVRSHQLVSADPLHVEPSVYWPECCGLHGFIRDGRWTSA